MKLRLAEGSLRLRLSPGEETSLKEAGQVESVVWLDTHADPWRYSVEILTSVSVAEVILESRGLKVRIPREAALPWMNGTKPGITLEIPTGGPALKLIVEMDLRP